MTDEREAIERLERRVAELEALVRRLAASSAVVAAPLSARPTAPPPGPLGTTPRAPPAPLPRRRRTLAVGRPRQWVGERGLLAVGVLALLATGGFFLNYAFDRGWIPEWLRATAAVLAGAGVATWGDRLVRRGLRAYGAALIGAGGGLAYLGFWAAAGPYGLVPKDIGVLLLAVTSGAVAVFAARHDVEALAVWALSGAYLAPVFLPEPGTPVEKFFAYMAVAGNGSLFLGYRLVWRTTFDVALFGFFLLPVLLVASELDSVAAVNYVAFGGVLACWRPGAAWPEARLGALVLPWLYLLTIALNAESQAIRWTALASGLILAAVVWWQHLGRDPLARSTLGVLRSVPEAIVYVAGPIAAVYLAAHARPQALATWGGAVALALAGLYLGAGWLRRRAHSSDGDGPPGLSRSPANGTARRSQSGGSPRARRRPGRPAIRPSRRARRRLASPWARFSSSSSSPSPSGPPPRRRSPVPGHWDGMRCSVPRWRPPPRGGARRRRCDASRP
jgi:uncharacterized membrane protein